MIRFYKCATNRLKKCYIWFNQIKIYNFIGDSGSSAYSFVDKKRSYGVICTTLWKEYDITWLNKCDQTSG